MNPTQLSPRNRGILFASLATIGAAGYMIPWKLATAYGSPFEMVFYLMMSAGILNTIVLFFSPGGFGALRKPTKREWFYGVVFALLTLFGNWASAAAIVHLSPALVSLLMRSEVIFVALIAFYFLGEKVGFKFWLGIAIVAAGFAVMQGFGSQGSNWILGASLAVASALSFAMVVVLTRREAGTINFTLVNSMRLFLSIPIWILISGSLPSGQSLNWQLMGLVSLAAFLGPSLGRLLFMFSSHYLEARISALVACGAPVMTLFFSFVFLGQVPTGIEVTGGGIMLFGIVMILIPMEKWLQKKELP